MASKNIIQILIDSVFKDKGFKEAKQETAGFGQALGGVNQALGLFGLAIGTKEVIGFALEARQAAIAADNAKNKLTLAAGGAAEYEQAMAAARASTNGMVSDAKLANGAFVLLQMNLAQNAQEAAQLANAGQILSKAFESQGASVELFNRLLANGSAVLLDNFGISQAQVKVRQEQIEAATGLESAEARLQAIRDIAIQKSTELAGTLSAETIATEQNIAAKENMIVALGNLVQAAGEAANATENIGWFYERSTQAANGFSTAIAAISVRNDLAARTAEKLGRALTVNEMLMFTTGEVTGEVAVALGEVITETNKLTEAQKRGIGTLDSYRQMADLTAKQMEAGLAQALDAQTARWQGLANAQRTASGGKELLETMAGGSTFNAQEAADFEVAQKEKERVAKESATAIASTFDEAADSMASSISSAVGGAFNRLQEVMPDIFGGGGEDQAGEFARRMAALQDGVQESDLGFLEAFKAQAGGSPIFAALLQSLEEGDQAGVASEATRLMQDNLAQVLAVGLADSIKAKMAQEDIMAEAQQIVADQLGQVEKKVVNISTAAGEMRTETKGAAEGADKGFLALEETLKRVKLLTGGINGDMEAINQRGNTMANDFGVKPGASTSNATNEQLNR